MRIALITIVAAAIVLGSCTESPKRPSFNADTLATVYAELLVLNERYSLSKDTLSPQQYQADYEEVLSRHKFAKDQFAADLEAASLSPDTFRLVCDRAMAQFQEMRKMAVAPNAKKRP